MQKDAYKNTRGIELGQYQSLGITLMMSRLGHVAFSIFLHENHFSIATNNSDSILEALTMNPASRVSEGCDCPPPLPHHSLDVMKKTALLSCSQM